MESYRVFLLRNDDLMGKPRYFAVDFLLQKIIKHTSCRKEIFMSALRKHKSLIALAIAVIVIAILAIVNFTGGEGFTFANSLWAILPPVVAIGLALITKEVYSSLFVGILIGALMSANFNFAGTMDAIINDGLIASVSDTAGIFIFLVILGVIVALVNKTGASSAFGHWAETHIKTKAGAMLATFALGVLIFIDDYFNCLTVGAVMSPVTDAHKISRVKLAYIIDATAAPICMIAPVSSWAAAVSGYVDSEAYSGIEVFIRAIPFNFYSLMTLVFVITLAVLGFDYGKMSQFEIKAQNGELGALTNIATEKEPVQTKKVHVYDLLIPVIVLVVASISGLLYIGGFFNGVDFVSAFADTDATVGLPWGALIALVLIIAYLIIRRLVSFEDAMKSIPQGFIAMVPAILILTFATGLKNVTGLLDLSSFVKETMAEFPPELAAFLPAVVFLIACVLAFSTGTSWGTFGILIPIVLDVFAEGHEELLFVGISACLAGAVCGDHCSPISDTTIMASAGANCNHVDHVSTQLPYAITVAAISFVSFLVAGFVPNAVICLIISTVLTIGTLIVIRIITKKKKTA